MDHRSRPQTLNCMRSRLKAQGTPQSVPHGWLVKNRTLSHKPSASKSMHAASIAALLAFDVAANSCDTISNSSPSLLPIRQHQCRCPWAPTHHGRLILPAFRGAYPSGKSTRPHGQLSRWRCCCRPCSPKLMQTHVHVSLQLVCLCLGGTSFLFSCCWRDEHLWGRSPLSAGRPCSTGDRCGF